MFIMLYVFITCIMCVYIFRNAFLRQHIFLCRIHFPNNSTPEYTRGRKKNEGKFKVLLVLVRNVYTLSYTQTYYIIYPYITYADYVVLGF